MTSCKLSTCGIGFVKTWSCTIYMLAWLFCSVQVIQQSKARGEMEIGKLPIWVILVPQTTDTQTSGRSVPLLVERYLRTSLIIGDAKDDYVNRYGSGGKRPAWQMVSYDDAVVRAVALLVFYQRAHNSLSLYYCGCGVWSFALCCTSTVTLGHGCCCDEAAEHMSSRVVSSWSLQSTAVPRRCVKNWSEDKLRRVT